jgi:hypothetical protein
MVFHFFIEREIKFLVLMLFFSLLVYNALFWLLVKNSNANVTLLR